VFDAIKAARPPRLYVSADGPRINRKGEKERCDEVREIATSVDWPCDVYTLFRETNLGCNLGPSEGISWFFENEDEGIVLEDDILPVPSFFSYCDELLERYRNDKSLAIIGGSNLISSRYSAENSYFFSKYCNIWGWASWRRTWIQYDGNMDAWPEWKKSGGIKKISDGDKVFEKYWTDIFDRAYEGDVDYWDYQLIFSCWYNKMISVWPAFNQTFNIGFGEDATHTTGKTMKCLVDSVTRNLNFPLNHPDIISRSIKADDIINRNVYGITNVWFFKNALRSMPGASDLIDGVKGLIK
jgi:hypothetical protein